VLELENVVVVNQRAESVQPEKKFDAVISRAFSSLANFVLVARHWAAPGGKLFAMKGGYPREEIAALPKDILVEGVESLRVPGLGAERHLVVMRVN
jgi:16S rRNA (guanine527-N7)-methyltransferase